MVMFLVCYTDIFFLDWHILSLRHKNKRTDPISYTLISHNPFKLRMMNEELGCAKQMRRKVILHS